MTARRKISLIEPRWFLVIVFFGVGVFLGWLATYLGLNLQATGIQKLRSAQTYSYINPLLAADNPNGGTQFARNKSMELALQNIISTNTRSNSISYAALYFRDIDPGYWVGINEDATFSPGIFLKIPIMMAYYKIAETDPEILTQEFTFAGPPSKNEEVLQSSAKLVIGRKYTVDELISGMIVNYNEDAANLLFDNIDKPTLNEVFSDLGIDFKEDKTTQDFISIKHYGLFYRVLYNSTFLNRQYSEKALSVIDKANDSRGLAANVPKSVVSANRSSARVITGGYEMYDCGLFYYPKHTYLLCGFARGKNLNNLISFLNAVGGTVYKEMDYEYGANN